MPMLDCYIPAVALSADDEAVRQLAWVSVIGPETVYLAGQPTTAPRHEERKNLFATASGKAGNMQAAALHARQLEAEPT